MRQKLLSADEVLKGYDAVSQLYPYFPSVSMWRAWEYAAYQRYTLLEPVLDLGCGDGRFFHYLWPLTREVVGVDLDLHIADVARRSGIYREVYATPAHQLPLFSQSFASAFANCSLEHMDNLSEVLQRVYVNLRPGGSFLISVVTDKFLQWITLPSLLEQIGDSHRAQSLRVAYEMYHHLVNPISLQQWHEQLMVAGFDVVEYIPIVPELSTRLFLFVDHLWHAGHIKPSGETRELGDVLFPYLKTLPHFPQGFRLILDGVMRMELDWCTTSGVIFWARRSA